MQMSLPLPARSTAREVYQRMLHRVYGPARNHVLLTDLRHIGTYVARIFADPRTLNHAVIVWEDERRQIEACEVAGRVSGEGGYFEERRELVSGAVSPSVGFRLLTDCRLQKNN